MGARRQQPLLTALSLLACVPLLAAETPAPTPADDAPAAAPEAAPEAAPRPAPAAKPAPDVFGAAVVASLRGLADAYSQKRRTAFMKLVSDDYQGDLGTLEDALSSDFRSYRTIELQIIPRNVETKNGRASAVFHYDMAVTDDRGRSSKFSGNAQYTFASEDGKARLLRMDRTPIFGTSLSSIENPQPVSQGAPTTTAAAAPGCAGSVAGTASFNSETGQGFRFSTAGPAPGANSDVRFAPPNVLADAPGAIVDMGPCDMGGFTSDPASIPNGSEPANVGDCYAVRTKDDKFGAFKILSISGTAMTLQYKYQPSGQRCF